MWKLSKAFVLLAWLGTAGCEDSTPCSPGETSTMGNCQAKTEQEGDEKDAAEEEPDAGSRNPALGDPTDPEAVEVFGKVCTDDDDCSAKVPFCAIMPGADEGYCSRTDCLKHPDICPDGWDCFDLSVFDKDLPAFCSQP